MVANMEAEIERVQGGRGGHSDCSDCDDPDCGGDCAHTHEADAAMESGAEAEAEAKGEGEGDAEADAGAESDDEAIIIIYSIMYIYADAGAESDDEAVSDVDAGEESDDESSEADSDSDSDGPDCAEESPEDTLPVGAQRILTQEDMVRLRRAQRLLPHALTKRTYSQSVDVMDYVMRDKQTAAERRAHAKAEVDESVKHTRKWGKKTGGSTNAEKRKTKNQVMMAHSFEVRSKGLRARGERDMVARIHASNQKKKYKRKSRKR
ncbi:hypothetical protein KIPB_009182 [Kipferlia bialata]|uniref:Protein SDA1 n=1 Tax=Kipferlia bialata TaxID=797122 RepID=A0A9K3D187_9EUKA|nr:hypothetical protein KIPB_009182 [Kipferlia bialata]|eukprot:g9182.t1